MNVATRDRERRLPFVRTVLLAVATSAVLACGGPAREPSKPEQAGIENDWTQFRGPGGSGVTAREELPVHWDPENGIRWGTELPDGFSQPIAFDGRIFVAAGAVADDKYRRELLGLDEATGEILFRTEIFTAPKEKLHHQFGSVAMSTPMTDGESIYVYFGPNLARVGIDGELVWSREIDPSYWEESRYGAASSPVISRGKVIIFRDDEKGLEDRASWLAAYDSDSGEQVWRTEWIGTCCSYATPLVLPGREGREILVATSPRFMAFDTETGEELWAVDQRSVQVVPSPVAQDDLLVVSGAYHDRQTGAFRLSGLGEATNAERLWTTVQMVPQIASPVLYEGILYQITDQGILTAWDGETGVLRWRRRLHRGPYWSSLVAGDGKVYALSGTGMVSIVRAGVPTEVVAENQLPVGFGPLQAMSVSEECLLFRAQYGLYCVEGSGPPASAPPGGEESAPPADDSLGS